MATIVPPLNVPQSKLDKLAADLAKLSVDTTVQVAAGAAPVPAFQRQGYLHKLGHSRQKWFHRFFVLRDSFLLSYNLQKSDFTVEPRSAIHLGNCSIQALAHNGKDFCFLVTTMQKDRFLFAAETEEDRQAWVRDLSDARNVTHANMIKLAVENQCLAEEKGAAGVTQEASVSALALFSNQEYIQNTPITGGAEGWLRTLGFNPEDKDKKTNKLNKCYFILRDSHLMMFQGGDILTKPRGAMYLLGTVVVATEQGKDKEFHFSVKSMECGDEIALVASTSKVRARWTTALRVGARVSYPDYKALLKEHQLLSKLTMTPRARPNLTQPNQPQEAITTLAPPPLLGEDIDVQGEQLDPATNQPYDDKGNVLLRNPKGKLVNSETGELVQPNTARFNASGQQLDPFNRPLPPGAVPMFTSNGQAIGVGPDGNHYLPSGETVSATAKHFDAQGKELDQKTVNAATAVAGDIGVAIKVRNKLKGVGAQEEAVDVLGRTFRDSKDSRSSNGMLVNRDGDEVPLASARKIESNSGQLVDYKPEANASETSVLTIKIDDEGDEKELGKVEINTATTLREVRNLITSEIRANLDDFVFLWNQVPLLKYEEMDKLAHTLEDNEVVIRGKELKSVSVGNVFSKKVGETIQKETKVQQEQSEFNDIMNRVRQGKFLRNTKHQLE